MYLSIHPLTWYLWPQRSGGFGQPERYSFLCFSFVTDAG